MIPIAPETLLLLYLGLAMLGLTGMWLLHAWRRSHWLFHATRDLLLECRCCHKLFILTRGRRSAPCPHCQGLNHASQHRREH